MADRDNVAAGEAAGGGAGAEVDGGGVFGNVCNAVRGEGLYGDGDIVDKGVWEEASEAVQVGTHEGVGCGAGEFCLPHGPCSNPNV